MGIPHVTMDEISRAVGIGKGTLYKFFPSKEALLFSTIEYITDSMEKSINRIMQDEKLSPIEKLTALFKVVAERLAKVNPSALAWMERSLPEAYDKIAETRKRIILTNIVKLFEDGKKSGLFDPEMDAYLVAHILIGAANHIMNSEVLSNFNNSIDNIFHDITSTLLNGCLTEEGRRIVFSKQ
jgi:AcrR family transcriptional regulator